jgi:hypothetical protein
VTAAVSQRMRSRPDSTPASTATAARALLRHLAGARRLLGLGLAILAAAGVFSWVLIPSAQASGAGTKPSAATVSWLRLHDVVFLSLQTDLKAISRADDRGAVSAIVTGCQQLGADLGTIRRVPPIPDASIQRTWAAALGSFKAAADDCVRGLVDNDRALAARYGRLLRAGVADVDRVLAALRGPK